MLRNITPTHLRCSIGACPAVYRLTDGTLAIVGNRANSEVSHELHGKVAPHEEIVTIKPEYLAKIIEQQKHSES